MQDKRIAFLLACGLRRHEGTELTVDHLQRREGHWAVVDLCGKGRSRRDGSGSGLSLLRTQDMDRRCGNQKRKGVPPRE